LLTGPGLEALRGDTWREAFVAESSYCLLMRMVIN